MCLSSNEKEVKAMETITLTYPHTNLPDTNNTSVCAIGFFDGIHKGHQKVIERAKAIAGQKNKKLAVMTFTPHPSAVLEKNNRQVSYLTPLKQKQAILKSLDVDLLYIVQFDLSLAQLDPQSFIDHFIVDLNICHLVCGFDFTYGHMGKGNVDTLLQHASERFGVSIVGKYSEDDEKVSSTRIRKLLAEGKVDLAKYFLTRPLTTEGKVVHGYKRGRQIGYPTANLAVDPKQALPRTGVYYVKVDINHQQLHGMASLGYNPTFEDDKAKDRVKLEVHLLDFTGELYDETLIVHWEKFIRPEYKFDGVEQLITQINQDEIEIRQLFQ